VIHPDPCEITPLTWENFMAHRTTRLHIALTCAVLTSAAGAAAAAPPPSIAPMYGFSREHADEQRALEQRFDAALSATDQRAWLQLMTTEPNHVGSPHDKANAEWMLARFKEWGWDARIEIFSVLYPTPRT
jgi:N-acetylated-alpha-linked acidic dipeptidase